MRPFITKQTKKFRTPIPAEERLAITLRYLATGETYEPSCTNLEFIGPLFLRLFKKFAVPFTKYYMKLPSSPQEWKAIADERYRCWNFPNYIGAADGKHVAILKPKHSGSDFYNYNGFYSVVLLAFLD